MSDYKFDHVRLLAPQDIAEAVALQSLSFPAPFDPELLWKPEHLQRQIELFPNGQLAAVGASGNLLGTASNVLISGARWAAHGNWEQTTGGPFFTAFDPSGTVLYGADISVHPAARRQGIGRGLYEARFALCNANGWRYVTGCRLPGLRAASDQVGTAENYIAEVVAGSRADATLTPLLRMGLSVVGISVNYMEDEESMNSACLLEWS